MRRDSHPTPGSPVILQKRSEVSPTVRFRYGEVEQEIGLEQIRSPMTVMCIMQNFLGEYKLYNIPKY